MYTFFVLVLLCFSFILTSFSYYFIYSTIIWISLVWDSLVFDGLDDSMVSGWSSGVIVAQWLILIWLFHQLCRYFYIILVVFMFCNPFSLYSIFFTLNRYCLSILLFYFTIDVSLVWDSLVLNGLDGCVVSGRSLVCHCRSVVYYIIVITSVMSIRLYICIFHLYISHISLFFY